MCLWQIPWFLVSQKSISIGLRAPKKHIQWQIPWFSGIPKKHIHWTPGPKKAYPLNSGPQKSISIGLRAPKKALRAEGRSGVRVNMTSHGKSGILLASVHLVLWSCLVVPLALCPIHLAPVTPFSPFTPFRHSEDGSGERSETRPDDVGKEREVNDTRLLPITFGRRPSARRDGR